MSTLYDRALFDLGGPGWKPDAGHPAAGKAFSRPWNRRPMQAAVDVRAIELRLADSREDILGYLGIPVPDRWAIDTDSGDAHVARLTETVIADVAAKAMPDFGEHPLKHLNLVGWFSTGENNVFVRVALYTRGKPCVAVVGKPSPACHVSLKRRGFVEADGMLVREWRRTDVARVVAEVFRSSKRIDVSPSKIILRIKGESPFPTDEEDHVPDDVPAPEKAEGEDGGEDDWDWGPYEVSERDGPPDDGRGFEMLDGYESQVVRWLGSLPAAALPLPRMAPETAIGLCRAAAILHAADARQPDMEFSAVRSYVEGLGRLAKDIVAREYLTKDAKVIRMSREQLLEISGLHTARKNLVESAGIAVRTVAVQWIAVAFHESLCHKLGVPPEAVESHWRWDPFAEEADPTADAERETAHGCERRAAEAAAAIARIPSSFEACVIALRKPDARAALDAALAAFPREHDKAAIAGVDRSRIRLSWDALAIWSEARPRDVPTIGVTSTYSLLVAALYHVATGEGVENAPTNHERLSGILMRPNHKAVLALRGQQEGPAGGAPVVVGWPVDAPNGRFLQYIPMPGGLNMAGPAAWREREKLSKSTKRLDKV